ncbi:LysE family translocator [Saccharopolyspora taberi]|uniref:LysE family translocator n=1 Tax=Saccharopolyspora taberi TaxID=60895 RepID=A0ABN3V7N2_9PSEU
MTSTLFAGFVLVAAIGVMTPGLDVMLVLRQSLLGGRRTGVAAVVGISLGCVVWGTASIVGLTALLTASRLAYDVVRLAGAAYLLYLGGTALWKSLPRNRKPVDEQQLPARRQSSWAALRTGLLTNLLNPKVGVFYISLLPQFLPAGPQAPAWGALLVGVHVSLGLLWLTGLTWIAGRARALFQRDRVRAWMDRVTASVLVGLGLKLALEGR